MKGSFMRIINMTHLSSSHNIQNLFDYAYNVSVIKRLDLLILLENKVL